MAIDSTQLISDAQCILACVPPGMIDAAQLASLASLGQATVVTSNAFVVTTNGVLILAANPKRRMAVLLNTSGGTLAYVGPSTVTTSGPTQGSQLGPLLSTEEARMFIYSTGELYAASTGANIRVLEFFLP